MPEAAGSATAAAGAAPAKWTRLRTPAGGAPGTDGVAVAIELLPDDYQP